MPSWTAYIYIATGEGQVILDRTLTITYNDKYRLNQRVDLLRESGKQVFILKNIKLKNVLT